MVTVSAIAHVLRQALDGLAFQQVLDLAPPGCTQRDEGAGPRPIAQQPQIDASVLELDAEGRIVSSGTVLMSPRYPHGVVVPVDRDLHTTAVRWREWDDAGWYANQGHGTVDVVPGRENAPLDFMLPYPASVLKVMVAFGVLRLVDRGAVGLDDTYHYRPATISPLCGAPASGTVRGYLDAALTWSSNAAGCALIKLLADHDAIDTLNRDFAGLGLQTLRLLGTDPGNGGRWSNAITMSSLDTAKLLALVNGAPGALWRAPDGTPVTSDVLRPSSRRLLDSELAQQGWNWMLSTANFGGRGYPVPGIPQVVAPRWIAQDGTVTVNGVSFGCDVRPGNRAAQVTFAHKPGWMSNSAADAGIVRSLPGAPYRHYIIAVFSNLGAQYRDPHCPPVPAGTVRAGYTQKFAQLGRMVDEYEVARYRDGH